MVFMLHRSYFTELFLTSSRTRPRLLFPQLQNPYKKSSLVAPSSKPVIFNPSTQHYVSLPKPRRRHCKYLGIFLGFDPIDNRFKVLWIRMTGKSTYKILTLGTGEMRSEKLKFIDAEFFAYFRTKFINYKGRFRVSQWKNDVDGNIAELRVWVLQDIEKQKWSKNVYTLPAISELVGVAGATSTGDIVLSMGYRTSKPFYVSYFNLERNTLQSVEIQGFGECSDEDRYSVSVFVDYVEDLNLNDANRFKAKTTKKTLQLCSIFEEQAADNLPAEQTTFAKFFFTCGNLDNQKMLETTPTLKFHIYSRAWYLKGLFAFVFPRLAGVPYGLGLKRFEFQSSTFCRLWKILVTPKRYSYSRFCFSVRMLYPPTIGYGTGLSFVLTSIM
ncbi:hypothetical protein HID58_034444 [Brassica napus]|uniref:F-box associated beta-propeller type 3 domain-containing protein n=1 Tax=Brassica napus TaxID=3708 RepID=A0ABQ8C3C6_BRANA|nr:hypothetical protein HID58_034444 [Brassica napus]